MEPRAWPLVQRWIRDAANPVEVLPADPEAAPATLEALNVTERSVLGALAVHTGGLSVDHGWLRVHGGPGLLGWRGRLQGGFVVGHDVVAGFFAVMEGDGEVRYLAPDSLAWEGTEMSHSAWVHWTLTGDLGGYYENLRWPGWEAEIAPLAPDTGLALSPPPFTEEGRPVARANRAPAPATELWDAQQAYVREHTGGA